MFFKKPINSAEYESISKKIISMSQDIELLSVRLESALMQIRSLRAKFNKEVPEEQQKQLTPPKGLNTFNPFS